VQQLLPLPQQVSVDGWERAEDGVCAWLDQLGRITAIDNRLRLSLLGPLQSYNWR
jgi:hypothetical protein